ncbi:hypothetical protein BCBMB205_10740 [Bacillus sp. CN2]|nr:hypothetical protein BCBMB205_10740 [Bacillus velezensis]ARZ57405.1 hypothetical protein BAGQ_1170 [Bacillus velezensis]GFR54132.1 hypothetical protein BCBMB205_10740 [Bacillus sp. CN2]
MQDAKSVNHSRYRKSYGKSKRRASISVKNKAKYIRRHLFKRCGLFVTRCRLVLPLNT